MPELYSHVSEANKSYVDQLLTGYDENKKPLYDETHPSFSSTFFLSQVGNKVAALSELALTGKSTMTGLNADFMPQSGSPLMNAASFDGVSGMETVSYVGAFGTENWLEGWANFDPNNTAY